MPQAYLKSPGEYKTFSFYLAHPYPARELDAWLGPFKKNSFAGELELGAVDADHKGYNNFTKF